MAEFEEYIAATKFNIGQDKENNIVVAKGTVVEYDGSIAKIEGREYNFPRLVSAIEAKWLISAEELGIGGGSDFKPVAANINMRAATPQGEDVVASTATMADEEREVSTIENFREGNHRQGSGVVSAQGGEEVGGVAFKTKAGEASKSESTRIDKLSHNAIRQMEEGPQRNDKAAHFKELERRKMAREIADLKKQVAAKQQQKQIREGIQFSTDGVSQTAADTTNSSTQDSLPEGVWDGNDAPVVANTSQEVEATEEDFNVTNKDSRLAFARQMMPNFDWDFGQHWKTKLKNLDENGNPLFVCTVYAVESSAMKKHIAKQFPNLNLGD